jgi:cytochrome c
MFSISMQRSFSLMLVGAVASVLAACSGGSSSGGGATKVAGNAEHGKELYVQCQGCHKLTENFTGPHHCGLIGRASGSVPDFDYSEAMQAAGITWTPKTLDEFLTSPIAYVSGTKMGFAGFDAASDRADVIAYLVQANADPAVCPK